MRALRRRGLAAVVLNFRGCSGTPNRRPRAYHSGETGDPAFVLRGLRRRFPRRHLGGLGFSLGGNVLLKLLAERRDGASHLEAAAAVSVPYDLAAGVAALERTGLGPLYARHFLRPLRRKVRERRELLEPFIDVDAAVAARTLREFDERVTAPLHGFESADAYYARSSSGPRLARIRTPTLLLHARDDPFLPRSALPLEAMEANPRLLPVVTRRGGHVGFVGREDAQAGRYWAEEEAARFLAGRFGRRLARPQETG